AGGMPATSSWASTASTSRSPSVLVGVAGLTLDRCGSGGSMFGAASGAAASGISACTPTASLFVRASPGGSATPLCTLSPLSVNVGASGCSFASGCDSMSTANSDDDSVASYVPKDTRVQAILDEVGVCSESDLLAYDKTPVEALFVPTFFGSGAPTEVAPRLYLGNKSFAVDVPWLKEHGVTALVNCAADVDVHHDAQLLEDAGIRFTRHIPMEDKAEFEAQALLRVGARAVHDAIVGGHTVFVFCSAGMSRSGSCLAACLRARAHTHARERIHIPCTPALRAAHACALAHTHALFTCSCYCHCIPHAAPRHEPVASRR
ncbi:hypothetical protein EON62_05240, partial [archaeon]